MSLLAVEGINRRNRLGGLQVDNHHLYGHAAVHERPLAANETDVDGYVEQRIVQAIARQHGVDQAFVRSVVEDAHNLVQDLVADDGSIFAPPLMYARLDDPVWDAVWRLFKARDLPEDLFMLEPSELADELGLETAVVERYPIYFEMNLLSELTAIRSAYCDAPVDELGSVLFSWIDSFDRQAGFPLGRPFDVPRVGPEVDVDVWLEDNLSVLRPFGYDLGPRFGTAWQGGGRQPAFKNRRKPEFVCRVYNECGESGQHDDDEMRHGDWVIIESSAVMADIEALHHLRKHVDLARDELAERGERVFGLLISDGATVRLQTALADAGLGYLTLAAVGYRDQLRGRSFHREWEGFSPRLRNTITTGRGIFLVDSPDTTVDSANSQRAALAPQRG